MRACLLCGEPTVGGRSRCPKHGGGSPPHNGAYGASYQLERKAVLSEAKVCYLCGLPGTPFDPLQADHVVPRSLGGTDHRSNMRAAHRSCNVRKGGSNRKPRT